MIIEFKIHEGVRGNGGDPIFVNPHHVIQVFLGEFESWEIKESEERVVRITTISDPQIGIPVMGDIHEVVKKLNIAATQINIPSEGQGGSFVGSLGSGAPNDPRP